MSELIAAALSWKSLLVPLLIFGLAPGVALRIIVLMYRRTDLRRAELIAELYGVPRWERPFWVAQQLETAVFDGLLKRLPGRLAVMRTFIRGNAVVAGLFLPSMGTWVIVGGVDRILNGWTSQRAALFVGLPSALVGVGLILLGLGLIFRGLQGGLLLIRRLYTMRNVQMLNLSSDVANLVALWVITPTFLIWSSNVAYGVIAGFCMVISTLFLFRDVKKGMFKLAFAGRLHGRRRAVTARTA